MTQFTKFSEVSQIGERRSTRLGICRAAPALAHTRRCTDRTSEEVKFAVRQPLSGSGGSAHRRSAMSQARGLTVFISDLRNCTNPEQERKRVEKEMAHIRQKFRSDGNMNGARRAQLVFA